MDLRYQYLFSNVNFKIELRQFIYECCLDYLLLMVALTFKFQAHTGEGSFQISLKNDNNTTRHPLFSGYPRFGRVCSVYYCKWILFPNNYKMDILSKSSSSVNLNKFANTFKKCRIFFSLGRENSKNIYKNSFFALKNYFIS